MKEVQAEVYQVNSFLTCNSAPCFNNNAAEETTVQSSSTTCYAADYQMANSPYIVLPEINNNYVEEASNQSSSAKTEDSCAEEYQMVNLINRSLPEITNNAAEETNISIYQQSTFCDQIVTQKSLSEINNNIVKAENNDQSTDFWSWTLRFIPVAIAVISMSIFRYIQVIFFSHQQPIFPFDLENKFTRLEKFHFNMMMIVVSILRLFYGWIRYRQIINTYKDFDDIDPAKKDKIMRYNKLGHLLCLIISVSIVVFAAAWMYQKFFIALISALVYMTPACLQTIMQMRITFLVVPRVNGRPLAIIRFIFWFIILILTIICQQLAALYVIWSPSSKDLSWETNEGGYWLYLAITILQWCIWTSSNFFMASFYFDFKRCKLVNGDIQFEVYK